jgi:hypothetical protein
MNPPAAGRFNERSKMMLEVGRPETEAKKNKILSTAGASFQLVSTNINAENGISLNEPVMAAA